MRILHTSDWHVGRTLHKVSLADAQRAALAQICQVAADERVDLVVVSGDVFDHAVPSAEALEMLEDALVALVEIAPVVITAGNHDSWRRLGYGHRLFGERLHVRTRLEDVGQAVEFADEHGPVRIYPIPYLHPDTARYALAEDDQPLPAQHTAVLTAAMDRVRGDLAEHPGARSVVLAHAWVAGGGGSDSERDISVGGLGTVATTVFAGVDYVALGHLHGPQEPASPDGRTRLRYSGSPLRYSFSEAAQEKSVTIVDLGPAGVSELYPVRIDQPRAMAHISGLLDEVLDPDLFTEHLDAWVSVCITDERRPAQMWPRVQQRFPHALVVRHEPTGGVTRSGQVSNPAAQKPGEVAAEFVKYVSNGDIEQAEAEAFDAAVQVVRDRERSA